MNILILMTCIVVSYFMGNISPAIILGKIYGVDVRKSGSGNAGTTNVLRTIGKKAGVITLIIDISKGFVVTFFSMMIGGLEYAMICGLAVIIGHMWPVLHGLKGGKGVATTLGVLLAVNFKFALALLGIVLLLVLVTRRVSVGVIIAAITAIPVSYFFNSAYPLWIAVVVILIIVKHKANIKRIFAGTEPKISFGDKEKGGKT